jgi:hypothetical protein
MKQILNLADVKTNDILMVVMRGKNPTYCIIHSCFRAPDIRVLWPHLSEGRAKKINDTPTRTLKMVEFDKKQSTWNWTVPVTTDDLFQSLIEPTDDSYSYQLYTATMQDVKNWLVVQEDTEVHNILQKALEEVETTKSAYSKVVDASMQRLLTPITEE